MKPKPVIAVLVALCLVVQCTGCSWIFMERSPENYRSRFEIECSGYKMPTGDTVASFFYAVIAFTYLMNSFDRFHNDGIDIIYGYGSDTSRKISLTFAALALIHGLSAWSGWCWASTCEETKNKREEWKSKLTPRQISALEKINQHKTCSKIESTMRSFPTTRKWERYIDECNGTWDKYVGKQYKNDHRYLKMMIIGEVSFNAKDAQGSTLLHYAASTGRAKLTKFLLKKGADPTIKDNEGKTAFDIAVEKGHEGVVELLKNAAGDSK
jgi:hypothetical protein